MLIAVGVGLDGKRKELGVSVSLGEQEVHWRAFMENLVKRGLPNPADGSGSIMSISGMALLTCICCSYPWRTNGIFA